ncbi:hypothetical protein A5707_03950 [Mycobacterium kyorinense]|uniref:Uncharacterized protein n=1 Tax=Mycobacterium kyorinense TaxID=487514 RepID=A0A1A2Z435_9MYCO|nr:hypothetical protein A5707_03950 [Mycobacterium kyorinense]
MSAKFRLSCAGRAPEIRVDGVQQLARRRVRDLLMRWIRIPTQSASIHSQRMYHGVRPVKVLAVATIRLAVSAAMR